MASLRDKNVCGLNVAVNDSFRVRCVQRVGNLNPQFQHLLDVQRFARNAMLQRHPVQKLHGDERLSLLFANVIDRADIGVIQCGCGLGFALKAG